MKDLTTYFVEPYILPKFGWDFDEWCKDNNITEPTNEDIEWFMDHSWAHKYEPKPGMRLWCPFSMDEINPLHKLTEMLHSVTLGTIVKTMQREFGPNYKECIISCPKDWYNMKSSVEVSIPTKLYKDDDDFDEFCKQLEILAWYFSYNVPKKSDEHRTTIVIEPINANDVTDYVMSKCGGVIYHVCRAKHVSSILRTGLRPKGKDTPIDFSKQSNNTAPTYRSFPNRIHFVCGESRNEVMGLIAQIINDKCTQGEKRLSPDKRWDLFRVIKIDLNKHHCDINFYVDGLYVGTNFIYTMAYFPPKYLESLKFDDI